MLYFTLAYLIQLSLAELSYVLIYYSELIITTVCKLMFYIGIIHQD